MQPKISLTTLNELDDDKFISSLAEIFEKSVWVAEAMVAHRPFASISSLHLAMVEQVQAASDECKLDLLRAHPELAGKEAQQGALTDSSTLEQKSAGLNALTAEEMTLITRNNAHYQELFGFPFIIAVKNFTKQGIFAAWQQRLNNSPEQEFETCLQQVYDIARIRLEALITE